MKILLLLFTLTLTLQVFSQQSVPPAESVYTDSKNNFSITFPAGWKQSPNSAAAVRFKAIGENGADTAAFNVIIKDVPGVAKVSSESFVELLMNMKPEQLEQITNQNSQGGSVTAKGKTMLAGKAAFYTVSDFIYKTADKSVPGKLFVITMLFEGKMYSVSASCGKDDFEKYYPVMQSIAAGFKLIPPAPKTE